MFTGIVEETGIVETFTRNSVGADISVRCSKVLENTHIGDSISINGVCQTVVSICQNSFKVNVSQETLNVTVFDTLKMGDVVNLERALTLNTRMGGHLVTGHVDYVGKVVSIIKNDDFYSIKIQIPKEAKKYVVCKGSITVNGISLTVAHIDDDIVKLEIIPHTFNNTSLQSLKCEDFVNIETDIIAKYVEKMLSLNSQNKQVDNISMEFLKENGYV